MAHPPQIVLPPIIFYADGPTEEVRHSNLDAVLPSPGYPDVARLVADAITKRTETLLLDYTRDSVAVRYQIDGVWHPMPSMDRAAGDYMLASMKKLANLNYQERRIRQEGEFGAKFHGHTSTCRLVSQGVPTGERVAIKIESQAAGPERLTDLGMRPKMVDAVRKQMETPSGLILFSTLPGDGFSTTWNVALNACDRLMRDFYSVEDVTQKEKEVINVEVATFDRSKREEPASVLPRLLLKQPDVFVFPEPLHRETVAMVCDLALDHQKLVFAAIHSRSAVEALLRILVLKPHVPRFAKALLGVVYTRLVRRLCDHCKQTYQPSNELLAKLGIRPGRIRTFYREYQPPPPEELVDAKGNPIAPPFCVHCQAIGYRGRTGIFEHLTVEDKLRNELNGSPSLQSLTKIATDNGHVSLKEEGVLVVAKGDTSISELQRVLKK